MARKRFKTIWVSPKITAFPSGILTQTQDLENFATASRTRCKQNSSTAELVDDTYDGPRVVVFVLFSFSVLHFLVVGSVR